MSYKSQPNWNPTLKTLFYLGGIMFLLMGINALLGYFNEEGLWRPIAAVVGAGGLSVGVVMSFVMDKSRFITPVPRFVIIMIVLSIIGLLLMVFDQVRSVFFS